MSISAVILQLILSFVVIQNVKWCFLLQFSCITTVKVLRKRTQLNHWIATDIRWNKNEESRSDFFIYSMQIRRPVTSESRLRYYSSLWLISDIWLQRNTRTNIFCYVIFVVDGDDGCLGIEPNRDSVVAACWRGACPPYPLRNRNEYSLYIDR